MELQVKRSRKKQKWEQKTPVEDGKNRNIQCYNCKERRHVMKNYPYSPRVIMRKRREPTTELKNALAPKFGVNGCSNSLCQ